MKLPTRRRLPRRVPLWVDPSKAHYFITISCKQRGQNQLARPAVAHRIFETARYRNAQRIWYARLVMLMTDHVHLLLSFPETEKRIQTIVSKWKEWTAKILNIEWQRDFFEHRLRKEETLREKADYILANPVRAGLVATPEKWPYVLIAEPLVGTARCAVRETWQRNVPTATVNRIRRSVHLSVCSIAFSKKLATATVSK